MEDLRQMGIAVLGMHGPQLAPTLSDTEPNRSICAQFVDVCIVNDSNRWFRTLLGLVASLLLTVLLGHALPLACQDRERLRN